MKEYILNNHFQGKAPANALMVLRALGRAIRAPSSLEKIYPEEAGSS